MTRSLGDFGADNRAGIARTLHRISCLRNRREEIVGLTLRVGRAVYGTTQVIEDLVFSGKSLLLLGRPGIGKTTMLRETARILSERGKRVVIVDTSNEIAGDGDIPHPAIGRARRMQVPTPERQHAVMVEAVENHMPEVIVIDEIGTELEALAARTIAERGVQLVATAHGNALANLMLNPTLADLIGGIQTVTLGDDEARRRGTQKSVLERKAPPTFDMLVEIQFLQPGFDPPGCRENGRRAPARAGRDPGVARDRRRGHGARPGGAGTERGIRSAIERADKLAAQRAPERQAGGRDAPPAAVPALRLAEPAAPGDPRDGHERLDRRYDR